MLTVIILNVVMLSAIMLNVVILSVVMLNVVAPKNSRRIQNFHRHNLALFRFYS
jgi:hypothetical protein